MSKRFTDSDKWKDDWYLSLTNDNRIVWQYMLDNCTNAGRLKKNFKLLNFCCNVSLDDKSFMETFKHKVIDRGDYYFIPKFIRFQYPKGLASQKPAIVGVLKELEQYDLIDVLREALGDDYLIISNHKLMVKDKETDKDKEKDKDKDKEKGMQGGKEKRKVYGEFKHVKLSDVDYEKLKIKFGEDGTRKRIENLDTKIEQKGYKYKNFYLTILDWDRREDRNVSKSKPTGFNRGDNTAGTVDSSKYDKAGIPD